MDIREARIEDVKMIAGLFVANWKATYRGMLQDDFLDRMDVSYGLEKWSDFMRQADNHILMAEEGGRFLGFAAFAPDPEIENCLYVDSLHVCAGERGKGIGTELLMAVREYAVSMNYDSMSICIVRGNDAARNLYCKLGAEHYSYFTDDFGGARSDSEKLIWKELHERL